MSGSGTNGFHAAIRRGIAAKDKDKEAAVNGPAAGRLDCGSGASTAALSCQNGRASAAEIPIKCSRRSSCQDCVAFESTSAQAAARTPSGFCAAGMVAQPAFMTKSRRS